MQNINKIIITGAIAISTLALGAGALAHVNANTMDLSINGNGNVALSGTVSAVSGNTISVSSWLGTWQVFAANATMVPANSTLADVKVGDAVKVSGTLGTGMSINATVIKDKSVEKRAFVGTISNVNTTAGTFTLATEKSGNVTVATNGNTQISINGVASVFTNLTNGMKASVKGSFNAVTNVVTADSVKVPAVKIVNDNNDDDNDNDRKAWLKAHMSWNKLFKRFWKD